MDSGPGFGPNPESGIQNPESFLVAERDLQGLRLALLDGDLRGLVPEAGGRNGHSVLAWWNGDSPLLRIDLFRRAHEAVVHVHSRVRGLDVQTDPRSGLSSRALAVARST